MIKILFFEIFEKNKIWEYDYIHNDILPDYEDKRDYFLSLEEIKKSEYDFDVLVYFCRDPKNYPWAHIPTYENVLECVKLVNPKIIIQLSDEFYHEDLQEHNQLGRYCELFLRQYNHENYCYTSNTIHIPLGYRTEFDIKNKIVKSIQDRKYSWSFVGTYKSDRQELIDCFSQIKNNKCVVREESDNQLIPSDQLVDYFLDSIFIPCSRGWSTIDTMRLYEASMSGAIPVLVSSKEEFEMVFKYQNNPPWLFFETWEEASNECLKLLDDKDELQKIQDKILIWWKNGIETTKQSVKKSINDSLIKHKLKKIPSINFISIEESIDRRQILYKNFERYGIKNITPHIFKKYNDYDHKIVGKDVDSLITKNSRGPVTSHLKAIKEWYENTDDEYTIFCEDDISFDSVLYWNFTWEDFFERLPEDWECIQLCVISDYKEYMMRFVDNHKLRNRDWCDWSCCAYLIKRSHAKNLIENYYQNDEICLEYKGWDLYKRNTCGTWTISPNSETMVYTLFYPEKETIYNFAIFLENVNFSSTWTEESYQHDNSPHNFSYMMMLDWWKTKGKCLTLDEIITNK
jgi:hypothetical protein